MQKLWLFLWLDPWLMLMPLVYKGFDKPSVKDTFLFNLFPVRTTHRSRCFPAGCIHKAGLGKHKHRTAWGKNYYLSTLTSSELIGKLSSRVPKNTAGNLILIFT